jgi:hypothetical protein
MRRFLTLLAAMATAVSAIHASDHPSLGYSDETTIFGPGTDACPSGVLIHNHDGSFEYGYGWAYGGVAPPYYGAFGEGYDLGAGTIRCTAYWVCGIGFMLDYYADCYVWEGGVASVPGAVMAVVTGVRFMGVGYWPTFTQHDIDMNVGVSGPFTSGFWGDWPGQGPPGYFCGADLDGPPGHPWTCIAPGIGYPSGWQDPSIVWGPTSSMGCGVYFEQGTPAESPTWGSMKALFQ